MTAPHVRPRPVDGWCPMGCGRTLRLIEDRVACVQHGCPEPRAVTTILADPETEHVVTMDLDGFSVIHPLRERLGHALLRCELHAWLTRRDPHDLPRTGTYRVTAPPVIHSDWVFVPLLEAR